MNQKMGLYEACDNINNIIIQYINYLKENESIFSIDEIEIGEQTLGLLNLQKNVLIHYKKLSLSNSLSHHQEAVLNLILTDIQSLNDLTNVNKK